MTLMRQLPPRLRSAVRAFAIRHRYLEAPNNAVGACCWASKQFCSDYGTGAVLHLLGCRVAFPFRDKAWRQYRQPDPALYHAVVAIELWCVDFTRRQFDRHSPFPFVQKRPRLEAEWCLVSARVPAEVA